MADPLDFVALSGVEQLGLIIEGERLRVPIADTVGFRLIEVTEGRVTFEGVATEAMYNPFGVVQGGWMATLLDAACGCAVHSRLKAGQAYTTLEIKTAFHRALTAHIPVRAEGRALQVGRRAGFAEADLRGLDGTLYASATSTCLVMERA